MASIGGTQLPANIRKLTIILPLKKTCEEWKLNRAAAQNSGRLILMLYARILIHVQWPNQITKESKALLVERWGGPLIGSSVALETMSHREAQFHLSSISACHQQGAEQEEERLVRSNRSGRCQAQRPRRSTEQRTEAENQRVTCWAGIII